jgi:hypothetical protein
METSAKARLNVDEAFAEIVRQIRMKKMNQTENGKKKKKRSSSCSLL